MSRWNLTRQTQAAACLASLTADDYEVTVAYRVASVSQYYGALQVVRKVDRRRLYPFEGAPRIGPFESGREAKQAAWQLGRQLVEADIRRPES